MYSARYGDLKMIAAKTRGRCHLCHEAVDLTFYGRTGEFGDDTVTVDHLHPVAFGGEDHHENLLLAHGHCNSRRGLDDPSFTRLALVGTHRAPASRAEQVATAVAVGGVAALIAGHVAAETSPDGTKRFNGRAAVGVGVLAAALVFACV